MHLFLEMSTRHSCGAPYSLHGRESGEFRRVSTGGANALTEAARTEHPLHPHGPLSYTGGRSVKRGGYENTHGTNAERVPAQR